MCVSAFVLCLCALRVIHCVAWSGVYGLWLCCDCVWCAECLWVICCVMVYGVCFAELFRVFVCLM